MRAVQLVEPDRVELADLSAPEPGAEALVRVDTVGICGTDLGIVAGVIPSRLPVVLGHEGVGVVEAPAEGGAVGAGQRVLIDPGVACQRCDLCRGGRTNLCRNGGLLGRDLDGVFAEYVSVAARQLHPVPDDLPTAAAGLLQVLGTCVHALSGIEVEPGTVATVVGLGVGGQLITQLLARQGATVIGVTRSAGKRALAVELGAAAAVEPSGAADAVAEASDGRGAAIVVEAVGREATLAQAVELAGLGGTIVLYGTITGGGTGLPYYQLYFKELTIRSPRAATSDDYRRAIELVAGGAIDVEPLVSARFRLDQAGQAFEAARDGATLKILMEP